MAGFFENLFRKKKGAELTVDLDPVMQAVHGQAHELAGGEPDADLLRACWADLCRDREVAPMEPAEFDAACAAWDEEAWRRAELVVGIFEDLEQVSELLPKLAPKEGDVGRLWRENVVGLVGATDALSLDLITQSPLRVEEFARHLLAHLGVGVQGEARGDSRQRLERLDYRSLLAEAERARQGAEAQMEYLRKLQEGVDARFAPRGKW
jgi:hypothetical protein